MNFHQEHQVRLALTRFENSVSSAGLWNSFLIAHADVVSILRSTYTLYLKNQTSTDNPYCIYIYIWQHAWVSLWPAEGSEDCIFSNCAGCTSTVAAQPKRTWLLEFLLLAPEAFIRTMLSVIFIGFCKECRCPLLQSMKPFRFGWWTRRPWRLVGNRCPVLFPDALIEAFWEAGEDVFRYCLFGMKTEDEIRQIWKHMKKHCQWVSTHPASGWKWQGKVASLGMYGDEIQCYRNSECGVVSVTAWTSEFCTDNIPLLRYYPIAIWSEHCESEFTYGDLEQHLLPRWRRLSDTSETWPWTDAGYLMAYTFCQGELKWINSRMGGLHNYRRNDFCSRCECVKNDPNPALTLPNMGDDPDTHAVRTYSSEQLQAFSPAPGAPWNVPQPRDARCGTQSISWHRKNNKWFLGFGLHWFIYFKFEPRGKHVKDLLCCF